MKIKLDENLPRRLVDCLSRHGYDVDTVRDENLYGRPDAAVWQAVLDDGRFLITQDLDFSDIRVFQPRTHAGLLLVRLNEPGSDAQTAAVDGVAAEIAEWNGCFVVLTDHKIRVRRP